MRYSVCRQAVFWIPLFSGMTTCHRAAEMQKDKTGETEKSGKIRENISKTTKKTRIPQMPDTESLARLA